MIRPSWRTTRRLRAGMAAGLLPALLLPFTLPVFLLGLLGGAIRYQVDAAGRLAAGVFALLFLWLMLFPRALSDGGSDIVPALFCLLVFHYLWAPGQEASLDLLWRGRGFQAGMLLLCSIGAVVISCLASALLLLQVF